VVNGTDSAGISLVSLHGTHPAVMEGCQHREWWWVSQTHVWWRRNLADSHTEQGSEMWCLSLCIQGQSMRSHQKSLDFYTPSIFGDPLSRNTQIWRTRYSWSWDVRYSVKSTHERRLSTKYRQHRLLYGDEFPML
jgi:hypothetical protein